MKKTVGPTGNAQLKKQGHTASAYGNDPNEKGHVPGKRELNPN
jgi:hypothetical protein